VQTITTGLTMHYCLKIAKPFSILLLALILFFSNSNSNTSLPIITITKQAQATTFTSFSFFSSSPHDSHDTASITKVQLPGIIPNNNGNNNPPNTFPPPSKSGTTNTSNATSNNPNAPPAPPIIHNTKARPVAGGPTLNDPNLKVEQIINRGFDDPTSMAFLGPNDILVLEKNTGKVHRILNGKILPQPLLDVNVANQAERGLLGIAVAKHDNASTENRNIRHVFLYYTESGGGRDGDDAPISKATATRSTTNTDNSTRANTGTRGLDTVPPAGNRLYRYDLDSNNKLTNPLLLLDLPASPPPQKAGTEKNHNGGKVLIGQDNNVYLGIGDVGGHRGQSENKPNGAAPDGTSGILRVTQDGKPVKGILGDTFPLNLYYAYGMRNTFGMDFDPLTGNLWNTENGNTFGDEINLVKPGFNSGWSQVAGIWKVTGSKPGPAIGADSNNPPKGLVSFGGKGIYRAPEFATLQTIAPTALKFFNSDKLGKQYENTIFIGDVDYGRLYNFKLDEDRTGLLLGGPLADKIANTPDEIQQGRVILGQGFGVITDIQIGPDDGYLYILTLNGSIYRIVPSSFS
jgi:glucose/arabinose dehydrogenase